MHHLGESCGPLTLDESINLLNGKEKAISELEKRVCELESGISIEMEQHSDELIKFNALLNDKVATIRYMEKELEKRPTQKLLDDLREKLQILECEISEKTSLLETAEKRIAELSWKIETPHNKWITSFKRIFSRRVQEPGTSKISKGYCGTNNATSLATLVGPFTSTGKKLVFLDRYWYNFELKDLLNASAEVLGSGTLGTTYKVVLQPRPHATVVVKWLKDIELSEPEFKKYAAQARRMKHVNIMPLPAYYYSNDAKFLLYFFVISGSLSAVLHGKRGSEETCIGWETRAQIILEICRAINYIHSISPTFYHGNIKSSNILLTTSYKPVLCDQYPYNLQATFTPFAHGYHAPEVTDSSKMSQKGDVYSFGVLMLELLTGMLPTRTALDANWVDLPRRVTWLHTRGRIADAFDVKLVQTQSKREDMMQLMNLAMGCTLQNPVVRPNMANVVAMIEGILIKKKVVTKTSSSTWR